MSEILIKQLIAATGPEIIGWLFTLLKGVLASKIETVTPEQWAEMSTWFNEDYEVLRARAKAELVAAGTIPDESKPA